MSRCLGAVWGVVSLLFRLQAHSTPLSHFLLSASLTQIRYTYLLTS